MLGHGVCGALSTMCFGAPFIYAMFTTICCKCSGTMCSYVVETWACHFSNLNLLKYAGVEVKNGETVKVQVGDDFILHLSQVILDGC